MTRALRRIRGAVGIAVVWGLVWAAVGALIGVFVDPASLAKVWLGPPVSAFPGAVGGVLFSALVAIAAQDRRLDELSLARVAVWGAMVGGFLGMLPFAINKPPAETPLWMVAGLVVGSFTVMGAVSAASSLELARRMGTRGQDLARSSR